MSLPGENQSSKGACLASLPEELLERILRDCIASSLSACIPTSTYATSPYPSPNGSPPATPTSSRQGSSPTKHPPGKSTTGLSTRSTSAASPQGRGQSASAVTLLLVSRLFYRVGAPLLYRSITLSSRLRTQKLLGGSLYHHPERAGWIRRLVIAGVWAEAGEVLQLITAAAVGGDCVAGSRSASELVAGRGKAQKAVDNEALGEGRTGVGLEALEITIDMAYPPLQRDQVSTSAMDPSHPNNRTPPDIDAQALCEGLACLAQAGGAVSLKELVLRKPQNVYLTHGRAKVVMSTLARVVKSAPALGTAYIAFRLIDDPLSRASPGAGKELGPIAALTQALSLSPHLHSIATHLPSVWNEALLRMSQNPALERIVLLGAAGIPVTFNRDSDARAPPRGQSPVSIAPLSLPPHPLDRIYTTSTRGCNGYAIAGSNRVPGSGMPAVPGTGVFMHEARKHEHLCALVHAGYMEETRKALASPFSVSPRIPSQYHQQS